MSPHKSKFEYEKRDCPVCGKQVSLEHFSEWCCNSCAKEEAIKWFEKQKMINESYRYYHRVTEPKNRMMCGDEHGVINR